MLDSCSHPSAVYRLRAVFDDQCCRMSLLYLIHGHCERTSRRRQTTGDPDVEGHRYAHSRWRRLSPCARLQLGGYPLPGVHSQTGGCYFLKGTISDTVCEVYQFISETVCTILMRLRVP